MVRAVLFRLAAVSGLLLLVTLGWPSAAYGQEIPWGEWPDTEEAGDAEETTAFGTTPMELYGSLRSTIQLVVPDPDAPAPKAVSPDRVPVYGGNETALTLQGTWDPSESVHIYVEGSIVHTTGISNATAWFQTNGLDDGVLAGMQAADLDPSYRTAVTLNQAWAQLRFSGLDVQLGRVPIAWGTGYAFNPTMRTHSAESVAAAGGAGDESTPGTAGIILSVPLGSVLSLDGYVAFEDRTHSRIALAQDSDPANLPWGARVRGFLGPFDVSAGVLREVTAPGADAIGAAVAGGESLPDTQRRWYGTADITGFLGDFGLYGEAAVSLFEAGGDWDLAAALESTVGFEYSLPGDVDLKLEYYRNGSGQPDSGEYDINAILGGTAPVIGVDYLFLYLGRTFVDYLETTLVALGNLRDAGTVLAPMVSYSFSDEFQLSAMAIVPVGPDGSEFAGPIVVGEDASVRLVRPTLMVQGKVVF